MYGGGAFVVLMIVAASFFPSNPLGNFASMMIWAFVGTIATLLGVIALFIGGRLYRSHPLKAGAASKEKTLGVKESPPPFLSPLIGGSLFAGIPVVLVLGLIAYMISPNLLKVPNMIMLVVVVTALHFALQSAAERSRAASAGKKEAHPGLVGASQMTGKLMLATALLSIAYYASTPGALTELLDDRGQFGQSVSEDDLPKDTLLDPGLSKNDVGKWIAKFNIQNPHILTDGVMSEQSTKALRDAANGYPMQVGVGSYINSTVNLSVTYSTGDLSDGILLYNGNCLSPTLERNGRRYTPKTCSGNWRTQSNSMMGVYAIVFKEGGKLFTVDLYVGDIIKGFPDMKLIIEKNGE